MYRALAPTTLALFIALSFAGRAAEAADKDVSPPLAAGVVNQWFHAFGRQSASELGAVTRGSAAADTRSLLQKIWNEAAQRKVGIELKIRNLLVSPQSPVGDTTPVRVQFRVAFVAHKWLFHKVAREWNGQATFLVQRDDAAAGSGNAAARIVGINLQTPMN